MGTIQQIAVRIVNKIMDNEKCVGYRIQPIGWDGENIYTISKQDLKDKILSGSFVCYDVSITKDNKMIEKKAIQELRAISKEEVRLVEKTVEILYAYREDLMQMTEVEYNSRKNAVGYGCSTSVPEYVYYSGAGEIIKDDAIKVIKDDDLMVQTLFKTFKADLSLKIRIWEIVNAYKKKIKEMGGKA